MSDEFVMHAPRPGILGAFLVIAVLSPSLAEEMKAPSVSSAPGSLILDDAPELLKSPSPVSPSHRDHLQAVALYSAGRMHERREEYEDALRCYQRALRCDPESSTIAQSIIPIAVRLKRYPEAVRYAVKAVALDDADPLLLRRLGVYLSEEGDWAGAATLFEKAQAARGKGKENAADILLQMEMGRLYYLMDKPKQAADCLARVLYAVGHPGEFALDEQLVKVLLGEAGRTYQFMGECFLAADRPQEAQTVFQKADEIAPDKALRQYNLARVAAKTKKTVEAIAALEASFAEHLGGEGVAPYELLAELLEQAGKKDELFDRLEKLRAADPNNTPLCHFLASRYREAGKLDKAELLYVTLLSNKPTLVGYRDLVQIHQQAKRYDALLAVLGEALEKFSILELIAAEAQKVSKDAEAMRGVVEVAQSKMKSEPDKFGFGQRLAVALLTLEAKQCDTADEFFRLALESKIPPRSLPPGAPVTLIDAADTLPSRKAEVLMVWGVGLLTADREAEAAKVFQRGVDEKMLPDDNPTFYFYLAGALAMAEQPDAALAAAKVAAEKKKSSVRYRGRPAWVFYVAKRYEEATKAYEDLIREFNDDYDSSDTRDALREARLALSNLAVIKGDMPQAEEQLEQVLDEYPDDDNAMNDLGYLWADQNKNLERAKRMIEKAVAAEPDNLAYRDSLGWLLYRMGKGPEAVAALEKAASAAKPDGVVLDHLGDAYLLVHQRDKAVETWRKAAETMRQNKEPEKAAAVEKKINSNQ